MVKFPCMKCGKPVSKKRRDTLADSTEGEACSVKCWNEILADCTADEISEAKAELAMELASEAYYDSRFHMMYNE